MVVVVHSPASVTQGFNQIWILLLNRPYSGYLSKDTATYLDVLITRWLGSYNAALRIIRSRYCRLSDSHQPCSGWAIVWWEFWELSWSPKWTKVRLCPEEFTSMTFGKTSFCASDAQLICEMCCDRNLLGVEHFIRIGDWLLVISVSYSILIYLYILCMYTFPYWLAV